MQLAAVAVVLFTVEPHGFVDWYSAPVVDFQTTRIRSNSQDDHQIAEVVVHGGCDCATMGPAGGALEGSGEQNSRPRSLPMATHRYFETHRIGRTAEGSITEGHHLGAVDWSWVAIPAGHVVRWPRDGWTLLEDMGCGVGRLLELPQLVLGRPVSNQRRSQASKGSGCGRTGSELGVGVDEVSWRIGGQVGHGPRPYPWVVSLAGSAFAGCGTVVGP